MVLDVVELGAVDVMVGASVDVVGAAPEIDGDALEHESRTTRAGPTIRRTDANPDTPDGGGHDARGAFGCSDLISAPPVSLAVLVGALYDLVEFRLITGGSDPELPPELELDEIDTLVGALVALERALGGNL